MLLSLQHLHGKRTEVHFKRSLKCPCSLSLFSIIVSNTLHNYFCRLFSNTRWWTFSSSLPLIWGPRFIVLLNILWNVLWMLTIPAKSLKADARGFRLVFGLQDRPALDATISLHKPIQIWRQDVLERWQVLGGVVFCLVCCLSSVLVSGVFSVILRSRHNQSLPWGVGWIGSTQLPQDVYIYIFINTSITEQIRREERVRKKKT